MNKFFAVAAVATAALLTACGGGGGDQPLVVPTDASLAVNSTVTASVAQTPFSFASGVPAFGTAAPTTVTFTSETASPAFSIASGGKTATGTTTFGSCIFTVTASDFQPPSPLAVGADPIRIDPCTLTVDTGGVSASGQTQSLAINLVLGTTSSTPSTATITVSPSGALTINGDPVGNVTVVPVTGS